MSDYKAILAAVDQDDVEELAMMARYIVEEHIQSYYGRRQKEYMLDTYQSPDAIKKEIEDGDLYFWIDSIPADEKESVLSMLDMCGYLSCHVEGDCVEIKNLYIMEEVRGRHLIRECMELLKKEETLKDMKTIRIQIPEGYTTAIQVFDHLGFTKTGKTNLDIGKNYIISCVEFQSEL